MYAQKINDMKDDQSEKPNLIKSTDSKRTNTIEKSTDSKRSKWPSFGSKRNKKLKGMSIKSTTRGSFSALNNEDEY